MENISRPWITLFSQTGKEIEDLSEILGRYPDLIITNNGSPEKIVPSIEKAARRLPNRPTSEEYRQMFSGFENPIITLHGWLRIIPADICQEYEIYNGHPALITEYPELKGFNAQERVAGKQEQYPYMGSVIHKVTPGVDEGEVLVSVSGKNFTETVDDAYKFLRDTSLQSWEAFFEHCL